MNIEAAALLDAIRGNAVVLDPAGTIVAANEAWMRFCRTNDGDPSAALPPASYFEPLPDDDPAGIGIRKVLDGKRPTYERVYPCHAPAEERWFRVVATRLAQGGALVVHYDVTDEQERIAAILDGSPFPIIELTLDGDAVYVSPAWTRVTGQDGSASDGRGWLTAIAEHDRGRVVDTLGNAIATSERCSIDARLAGTEGVGWIRLVAAPHHDQHGQLRRYVVSAVDVTADRANARRLAQVAQYDQLTGLPNRVQFEIALAASLAGLAATDDPPEGVGVLFIDLDDFKAVNDTHGHAAGDTVIRTVASRINSALRPGDTAARFGGDEFLVLATRTPGTTALHDLASRLVSAVREPIALNGGVEVRVGASVGGVVVRHGLDHSEVIALADQAMYRAKAGDGVHIEELEPAGTKASSFR